MLPVEVTLQMSQFDTDSRHNFEILAIYKSQNYDLLNLETISYKISEIL